MNILSLSLGDEAFTASDTDFSVRHLRYARAMNGRIDMLTLTGKNTRFTTLNFEDLFIVHPVSCANKAEFFFKALKRGLQLCGEHRPDLIVAQEPFLTAAIGLCLKKLLKIPLLVENHSSFIGNRQWIGERKMLFSLAHSFGKTILPLADAHRVVNARELSLYVDMGIPRERILLCPVPVDCARFTPAEPSRKSAIRTVLGINPRADVVIWTGRAVPFKRLPLLIEAFRAVLGARPGAVLLLVEREGPESAALTRIIDGFELNRRIIRVGNAISADMPAYYRAADIYVHTSVYEGFGRSMLEAALCGLPVVTTRTAGAEMIVTSEETGFLVPVDNPEDLAEKIIFLLKNREPRENMGRRGRKSALENYDDTELVGRLAGFRQQIAKP